MLNRLTAIVALGFCLAFSLPQMANAKFINFACDQGLIGDPDSIRPMTPQDQPPEEEKATMSSVDKTKGIAKGMPVELGLLTQPEDIKTITPADKEEEQKPVTEIVSSTTEETAKSTYIELGVYNSIIIIKTRLNSV